MKQCWLALALALCGTISAETNPVIRTAAELRDALCHKSSLGMEFELKATVLSAPPELRSSFIVADKNSGISLIDMRDTANPRFEPGDQLLITGRIERRTAVRPNDPALNANCKNVIVLAHGKPPEPVAITAADMDRDDLIFHPIRTCGILIDVRKDEIDPKYLQFIIDSSNRMIYAASYAKHFTQPLESLKSRRSSRSSIMGRPYA